MSDILTTPQRRESLEWLIELFNRAPRNIERISVSQWAEENRILAEGLTPYPGPYSFDVNPYMREIVDALSENSPVHEVVVMKGTQIMFTVGGIENWIGYTIDVAPAPMLYVTGDAGLADTQMELRIDSMIDNSGIAHKIGAQSKREGQRKTGDIKARKEFPGGFLVAAGPNSGAKLRSMSFKKINADEVDAFPDSTGKEGDPILLIRRRADAYSESYKILWGSTPLFEHNSKIKQLFREGDQRRFFVPCKHCGHMQYLRWGKKGEPGGLHFEHDDDDRLICTINRDGIITESSVRYVCEKCGGEWKNGDKDFFLPRGEWRPTAQPRRPGMRSYHIPGLLSPVGFRSWENAVVEYLDIKHQGFPKLKFQNWVNTFLGEPFEDRGEKPKIEVLLTRERNYNIGTLPEEAEALFVTLGADVQANRIEYELVAWGVNAESWSIDYQVIYGDTSDEADQVWEKLREVIQSEHAGFPVLLAGIDSGYRTDVVYGFAASFDAGVYPVMGHEILGRDRVYIQLATSKTNDVTRIDINTNLMKQEVYRYLSKGQQLGKAVGYCHFPVQYDREHYNRLTAETRIAVRDQRGGMKFKWDAGSRRNEQLDCRVYNLAMVHAYKFSIEESEELEEPMSWENFWDYLR
jgi:phage terminase large subunit GpA-like protein